MRITSWTIWTCTGTEKKAREVLAHLLKRMQVQAEIVSVEPEEVSGHLIRFTIALESDTWNDQVVEAIRIGQRVASGWAISGSIDSDPAGYSGRVSDSGVNSLWWSFQ